MQKKATDNYQPSLKELSKLDMDKQTKFKQLERSLLHKKEEELVDALDDYQRKRNVKFAQGVPVGGDYQEKASFYDNGLQKIDQLKRRAEQNENDHRLGFRNGSAKNMAHSILNGSTQNETRIKAAEDQMIDVSRRVENLKSMRNANETSFLTANDITVQPGMILNKSILNATPDVYQSQLFQSMNQSRRDSYASQNNMMRNSAPILQKQSNRNMPQQQEFNTASFGKPENFTPSFGRQDMFNQGPAQGPNIDSLAAIIAQKDKEMEMMRNKDKNLETQIERQRQMLEELMKQRNQPDNQPVAAPIQQYPPQEYNFTGRPPVPQQAQRQPGFNQNALLARQLKENPREFKLSQNIARNPDLNDFERAYHHLTALEADQLRILQNLPIGTDLYRFKVEQFKETSTTRAEVEKLMFEQQLREAKKGFERKNREHDKVYENLKWVDENRKMLLQARIRKDLAVFPKLEWVGPEPKQAKEQRTATPEQASTPKPPKKKGYDPTEGFIVYWDYCLGLPKELSDRTQFDFQIVREGEILYDTEEMQASMNIQESSKTMRCIFGEKSIIKGINIDPETLMIWKVKMPNPENPEEMIEVGWTQIDLFEVSRDLKRGRWKCPLYEDPYSIAITKEGVKDLTPIFGNWFYLRIAYPYQDDEFHTGSLVPEQSSGQAEIPYIHLRAANFRPKISQPPPQEIVVPPKDEDKPAQIVPFEDPNKKSQVGNMDLDDEPFKMKDPREGENREDTPPPMPTQRKGIILEVQKILSHIADSHLKVAVACFQSSLNVLDDTQKRWIRNTMIHNPFLGENIKGTVVVESEEAKEGLMANLAQGGDIVFDNQKFNFYRNLPILLQKTKGETLFLVFQVLEKPAPRDVLKIGYKGFKDSDNANLGGLEYQLKGYAVFELSTQDLKIKNGVYEIPLYEPGLKIPPYPYEKKAKQMVSGAKLQFKIMIAEYDEEDVKKEYRKFLDLRNNKIEKKKVEIDDPGKKDIVVDSRPYIVNTQKQYSDKTFAKGYGIDFYLDGLRFLPDNVTIVKAIIRVVNSSYKDIFPITAALPKFNETNDSYNPIFDFRYEYRSEFFDPTAMLLLTFVTIDKAHNESRVVGYSAINLFEKKFGGGQPESASESDIVLKSGDYQVSIYSQEPLRVKPFNITRIMKLVELPCASTLIRLRLAPLSDDLKRVMSLEDVKHLPRKDWEKMGIWPRRPLYEQGSYNNKMNIVSESDFKLFKFRQVRELVNCNDTLNYLLRVNGINKEMNKKEIFMWCNKNITYDSGTVILDKMFFAKYREQSGFKVAIDAIHNVPNDRPYIVFYTLNPPAPHYENPENTDGKLQARAFFVEGAVPNHLDIELNAQMDWERPLGMVKFHDS